MKFNVRAYRFLVKLPWFYFLPLMFGVHVVISLSLNAIGIVPEENSVMKDMGVVEILLAGCLLAPFLETLIFQFIPIALILYFNRKLRILAITVSALLFGLNHWFGWAYILYTFIIGLVFAVMFIVSRAKKGNGYAFLMVFVSHAFWNFFVFLNDHLFMIFRQHIRPPAKQTLSL